MLVVTTSENPESLILNALLGALDSFFNPLRDSKQRGWTLKVMGHLSSVRVPVVTLEVNTSPSGPTLALSPSSPATTPTSLSCVVRSFLLNNGSIHAFYLETQSWVGGPVTILSRIRYDYYQSFTG